MGEDDTKIHTANVDGTASAYTDLAMKTDGQPTSGTKYITIYADNEHSAPHYHAESLFKDKDALAYHYEV